MTSGHDFNRLLQEQQGEDYAAAIATQAHEQYRSANRAWIVDQKRDFDDTRQGTSPAFAFGEAAARLMHGFIDHMDREGWPDAQILYRRSGTPGKSPSIFDSNPPDVSAAWSQRGYCIGLAHTFRKAYPDFEAKLEIVRQSDGFFLQEEGMVYLCEDRSLRINPTQFESLPLNNESDWYDKQEKLDMKRVLKPATTGMFGTQEIEQIDVFHRDHQKVAIEVATFKPAALAGVLVGISLNPASGAPTPGLTVPPKNN